VAETEQVAADRDGAARHPHNSGTRADDGAGFGASPEDAVLTDPNGAADKDGSSKRFDRLTKRHRECLRGVRELKGSKEIADDLGIEKSTVDGYLTEAVKVLGARNRRDAAMQLAEHKARLSESSNWNDDVSSPIKWGGILHGYSNSHRRCHCRSRRTRASSGQPEPLWNRGVIHDLSEAGFPSGGKDKGRMIFRSGTG
jgi:DNA-binding CsgD family transcriptional regulator